jgi:FkbM family methyltransferase
VERRLPPPRAADVTARPLNPFVYGETLASGIAFPDIPVRLEPQYGQCGEDIVVASLVRARCFSTRVDPSTLRYCEIGGNHPIATSATWLLAKCFGMSGVLVEANPLLIPDLVRVRPNDRIVNAAIVDAPRETVDFYVAHRTELSSLDRSFVETWPGEGGGVKEVIEVPALSVDALMEREFPDGAPAYLSIDIEGMDLVILRALSLSRRRPFVIQVEPSDHHEADNSRRIDDYLSGHNYRLIAKTPVNMIYVDLGA